MGFRNISPRSLSIKNKRQVRNVVLNYNDLAEAKASDSTSTGTTRMWANAQPDGRPAEHRWRPLFNAPNFG